MTVKEYDHEEMVDAVKQLLETNLPAAINEVNSEKGNFPLDPPIAYHFGFRHVDTSKDIGNAVMVINANIAEGMNFNPGMTDEDFSIDAIIIYWDKKAETVERKILRYTKAIRKVLDTQSLFKEVTPPPSNVGDSVVSMLDWNPTDFEGEVYFKSATVRLKIRDTYTYED